MGAPHHVALASALIRQSPCADTRLLGRTTSPTCTLPAPASGHVPVPVNSEPYHRQTVPLQRLLYSIPAPLRVVEKNSSGELF